MKSQRRPIIAGNWKMNKTTAEARDLAQKLVPLVAGVKDRDVVLAPPFTALQAVTEAIKGTSIVLSAQNMSWEDKGAFTGEISAEMLLDLGCKYVIIGHSERRQYFGETDETVNKKVKQALKKGLLPIMCVGETLAEREAGRLNDIISRQVTSGLKDISAERITAELLLILKNPRSSFYFRHMDELGILDIIFPEIKAMKGCPQNGFHHMNVWEHSLLAVENTEDIINNLASYFGEHGIDIANNLDSDNRLSLLKLSAMLHDAGKPVTRAVNPDTGRITFYHHDKEGARLIDLIAARLKMSNRHRDFMVHLVGELDVAQ